MDLKDFCRKTDDIFPKKFALEGDRVGLQVDSGNNQINRILSAYELNEDVVEEAIKNKSDLITVFHPLIFRPLRSIDQNERVSKLVTLLLKNEISLYSIHTSFDTFPKGTNRLIADKLGLDNLSYLKDIDEQRNFGMGIVGEFNSEISLDKLLSKCSEVFHSNLKYNENGNGKLKKIAIIGGSGTSFLNEVEKAGVDAFITADTSYHDFHRANGHYHLIDPGHYEMEMYNSLAIAEILKDKLELEIKVSRVMTNPVKEFYKKDHYSDHKEFLNNIRF